MNEPIVTPWEDKDATLLGNIQYAITHCLVRILSQCLTGGLGCRLPDHQASGPVGHSSLIRCRSANNDLDWLKIKSGNHGVTGQI